MRILHVGNFGSRAKGAFLHSVAPKLSRGLVRLGHQVVDFADRDVARASTLLGSRKLGISAVNRTLRRLASDMRPEIMLLGHADTIRAETIVAIRADLPHLRVLQWNVDPVFEPDNIVRLRSKIDVVHATLVSTAGEALTPLRRRGMRLGFLPNPVDLSIESGRADLQDELLNDLFFACGHPSRPKRTIGGAEWDMDEFLGTLKKRMPGLRLSVAGALGQPHLAGGAYQEALASSAIGLNASRRNDAFLYSSDRLAHMVGNGQAILLDRSSGYSTLFGEDQMAFFSSFDDIVAQLTRLCADPSRRRALAAAGRARYHALFNETLVAGYVLGVACDTHDPAEFAWPTLID